MAEGKTPAAYKIIRGTDMRDLAQAVNEAIKNGWIPQGGPAYCPPAVFDDQSKIPHPLMQALVKFEP